MKKKKGNSLFRAQAPARRYVETVLAVNFEDARRYFFEALLEIHAAHTLMLVRQGIFERKDARACARALLTLDHSAVSNVVYDGTFEDLFFYVQNWLTRTCGEDVAGQMHTARSRNDIDMTMYRIVLRREILELTEAVHGVHRVLLDLAERHIHTVMPAYTHTQPAQPTTLAHYLLGMIEVLVRDEERLRAAFATANRSPLGACAITTTAFPIDREFTSRLLAFDGLQVNSYGAIAAVDYLTQAVSSLAVCMINLGRLVQDLLLWCTVEFGFLKLTDGYVQVSSIMPQKRNPVSLEHTRSLASKAFGQAQAVIGSLHNTPFGDIVDSEDDMQPLVLSAFTDAKRAFRLFGGLIEQAEVNPERLRACASQHFLTVTELADTLVRHEHLDFSRAHRLVSAAVSIAGSDDSPEHLAGEVQRLAPEVIGHSLRTPRNVLLRALDPDNFIRVRTVVGGPAPRAIAPQIQSGWRSLQENAAWVKTKRALLDGYAAGLRVGLRKL